MEKIYLEANGLRFAALSHGEGDRLALLLHGFPDDAGTMRGLMEVLAGEGYRCVAPYMRGYGETERPSDGDYSLAALGQDALGLIKALGAKQAVVIGHDWGSGAAYIAAMMEPKTVSKLVLIALPPPPTIAINIRRVKRQLRMSWYTIFFQLRGIAEWRVRRNNYAFLDRLWRVWSPGWDYPIERMDEVKATLAHPGSLHAALGYYRKNLALGAEPPPPLDTTAMIVAGNQDGCIAVESFEGSEKAFTEGCRMEVVADAGHFLHLERPQYVSDLILAFLE